MMLPEREPDFKAHHVEPGERCQEAEMGYDGHSDAHFRHVVRQVAPDLQNPYEDVRDCHGRRVAHDGQSVMVIAQLADADVHDERGDQERRRSEEQPRERDKLLHFREACQSYYAELT